MAKLNPIERTSLTTSLLDRYNKSPSIANVGGGSAKDAGTRKPEDANRDGIPDAWERGANNFLPRVTVASDASSEVKYIFTKQNTDSNVPTTKYKG
jgi:hypothetical protein